MWNKMSHFWDILRIRLKKYFSRSKKSFSLQFIQLWLLLTHSNVLPLHNQKKRLNLSTTGTLKSSLVNVRMYKYRWICSFYNKSHTEQSPCARHTTTSFIHINILRSHNKVGTMLFPFYGWGNWRTKKLGNKFKAMLLSRRGKYGYRPQPSWGYQTTL